MYHPSTQPQNQIIKYTLRKCLCVYVCNDASVAVCLAVENIVITRAATIDYNVTRECFTVLLCRDIRQVVSVLIIV